MVDEAIFQWIIFFMIYSFLGWTVEVLHAYYKQKIWINRGFLRIPFCPVYGFGGVLVIIGLSPLKHSVPLLFAGALLVITLLEYVTGFLLLKFLNAKWWNYEKERWNFKGFICPKYSILFAILAVITVNSLHPPIQRMVEGISEYYLISIAAFFLGFLVFDFVRTIHDIKDLYALLRDIQTYGENFTAIKIKERILKEKRNTLHGMENQKQEIEKRLGELKEKVERQTGAYEMLIRQGMKRHIRLIKAFPGFRPLKFQEGYFRLKEALKKWKKPTD